MVFRNHAGLTFHFQNLLNDEPAGWNSFVVIVNVRARAKAVNSQKMVQ